MHVTREMRGRIGWGLAGVVSVALAVAAATGRNWGATFVLALFAVGAAVMTARGSH